MDVTAWGSRSVLPGGSKDAFALAVADVNNDGHLDLVVSREVQVYPKKAEVQVLLYDAGTEDFTNTSAIDMPTPATEIAVGDLNGDGQLDLILITGGSSIDRESARPMLLIGDGSGGFLLNGNDAFLTDGGDTRGVALGDVDQDGDLDIILANYRHLNDQSQLQLLVNQNNGEFQIRDLPAYKRCPPPRCAIFVDVALGDVSGDGYPDIVVSPANGAELLLMLNDGSGGFLDAHVLSDRRTSGGVVAFGDLDQDGDLDIVCVGDEGTIFQNVDHCGEPDDCVTMDEVSFTVKRVGFGGSTSVSLGDVDRDGDLDVLIGKRGPNEMWLGDGDGGFTRAYAFPATTSWSSAVALGDLNGDGFLDVAECNTGKSEGVGDPSTYLLSVGRQTGTLQSSYAYEGPGANTASIAVGDLNGDDVLDLVLGIFGDQNEVRLGNGDGSFEPGVPLKGTNSTTEVALGDIDQDGHLDIVVANTNGEANLLMLNNGSGAFQETRELPGGTHNTSCVALGDLDGDGRLDIVFSNQVDDSNRFDFVQFLFNDNTAGAGTFNVESTRRLADLQLVGDTTDPSSAAPAGGMAQAIALGDLNGDDVLDVVVATSHEHARSDVWIQINEKTGTSFEHRELMAPEVRLKLDQNTEAKCASDSSVCDYHMLYSLSLGDFNGDGYLDVVAGGIEVAGGIQGGVNYLMFNDRSGFFTEATFLGDKGSKTTSISVVDINGDGNLDILLGLEGEANQLWLGEDTYSDDDASFARAGSVSPLASHYFSALPRTISDTNDLKVGDFDRDGNYDVVVGNADGVELVMYQVCTDVAHVRSPTGFGCVKCPFPWSADSVDSDAICHECQEHQQRRYREERTCLPCTQGLERPFAFDACTICPVGKKQDTPGTACTDCYPGKYSGVNGSIQCFDCAPGKYQREMGQLSCDRCAHV